MIFVNLDLYYYGNLVRGWKLKKTFLLADRHKLERNPKLNEHLCKSGEMSDFSVGGSVDQLPSKCQWNHHGAKCYHRSNDYHRQPPPRKVLIDT